ncbi:MAG: sugar phosphate isomerase/epimerase family protein [Dehalococcoidia bacterium]
MLEVSLSTMWAKGRFGSMVEFVAKARELGFTHIEANTYVSPRMFAELLKTGVPFSSIHSPCPAVSSYRGISISSLSLSSLNESERTEAVDFAKKTIDLAAEVRAKAIVLHMGEVPIDLSLRDKLYKQHQAAYPETNERNEVKEELVRQRASRAAPYLNAAKESLRELCEYSAQKGIMLGLETRFHVNEIPNIDEMAKLLQLVGAPRSLAGYWHDVGHAEVQQQLGFASHEEWLSRFHDRMIGIHLHDILGISDHHIPGTGRVNWDMIARYLSPGVLKVCEIGEWNDEKQMQRVIKFLQNKGIIG